MNKESEENPSNGQTLFCLSVYKLVCLPTCITTYLQIGRILEVRTKKKATMGEKIWLK